MSETTVRPVSVAVSSAVPANNLSLLPAAAVGPVDAVEQAHSYIVIGAAPQLSLAAPQNTLSGTLPSGEPWTAASLTSAQVRALQGNGVRVVENRTVHHPPIIREPIARGVHAENIFARDVHQANELAKLGPEWEGQGGLFISLDSGVAKHPDLPTPIHFDDPRTPAPEDPPKDNEEHGTHTTGSAVARGNPDEGGTRGMAPRADLAAVAVLDSNGEGSDADVLKGIEDAVRWAQERPDSFVVVNMSLGDTADGDPLKDVVVQAIEEATKKYGILFTVSAGNDGPKLGTINRPGSAPSAVTVGAMNHHNTLSTDDDNVAGFSSRDVVGGPKPTLVARGVWVRSTVPGGYELMSGTSMASPIVGGGLLDIGQGLLALYRKGDLAVDPRDLVRSGAFQEVVREGSFDNPNVPSNVEGGGDLRLMKLHDLFVKRYGTSHAPTAPPPIYKGQTPQGVRLSDPVAVPQFSYRLPFLAK